MNFVPKPVFERCHPAISSLWIRSAVKRATPDELRFTVTVTADAVDEVRFLGSRDPCGIMFEIDAAIMMTSSTVLYMIYF